MKKSIIKFLVRVLPRSLALRVAKADGEVTKFLLRTAEVLRTGGWQQHGFGTIRQTSLPHCYIGAMRVVAAQDDEYLTETAYRRHPIYFEARKAVKEDLGGSVPAWNDAPSRTAEEVIEHAENVALANIS